MLVFGLHQVVLRRRQGQVQDHGEAEDEDKEKNVPGLHRVSVRLLMADDQLITSRWIMISNCHKLAVIAAIKHEITRGG